MPTINAKVIASFGTSVSDEMIARAAEQMSKVAGQEVLSQAVRHETSRTNGMVEVNGTQVDLAAANLKEYTFSAEVHAH